MSPQSLREAGKKFLEAASANYERYGHADSPEVSALFLEPGGLGAHPGEKLAPGTRSAWTFANRRAALRADLARQHAFSRRRGRVLRRDQIATRLRWHRLSHRCQHRRTGTLRRYLPRVRSPLRSWRNRRSRRGVHRGKRQRKRRPGSDARAFRPGHSPFPTPSSRCTAMPILFDVTPAVERPSRKVRTSGFFADFAELKPGDYVVHIDHGIGQFEGLRVIESDGRRGEFMLLRYADDARLYVPLERMDLVQSYRVVEGTEPAARQAGRHGVELAQDPRPQIARRHGGPTAGALRRTQDRRRLCTFSRRQLAARI